MSDCIHIIGDFDGGNPKDPNSIIQTGSNSFTIIPFSEDNDPNYRFRLEVKIDNRSSETQKLNLTIDWQEPKFNHLRNYLYLKHKIDDDWMFLSMTSNESKVIGEVYIKPGETHLCLHPRYSYEDYLSFIHHITEDGKIKKEKIGLTDGARIVWLIKIFSGNSKPKKRILIVSRIHPYETAGSFCVEGIVEYFLKTKKASINDVLKDNEIYLIPMANPDGVYYGFCKLSAPNGIDLSKQISDRDSTSRLIREAIDRIKPHIYCELHNWMLHEFDGIYFLNWIKAKRFIRNLHSKKLFNKNWEIHLRKIFFSISPHGFKKYCRDKFGSICLCLEYPWRNRNTEDMKRMGIDSLMALTKM